jgi:hypothetical protein
MYSILHKTLQYKYIILISITFLSYIGGLNGKFVIDDPELIEYDSFYTTETNPIKCFARSFWRKDRQQNLYRPITVLSYWIETKIFSKFSTKNSTLFQALFRVENLLLHIITIILLLKFLELLIFSKTTSFFSALIFAVHPIHVEAVTPAFGRAELLCSLFLLIAFIFHIKSYKHTYFSIYAGIFAFAAFLSKENGIVFLPIIIILNICFSKKLQQQNLTSKNNKISSKSKFYLIQYSIYTSILAIVFIMHKYFLNCWLPDNKHFFAQIDNPIAMINPALRFISAIKIQGLALSKFFYPNVLAHDYSFAQILPCQSIFDLYAFITIICFLIVTTTFYYFYPKYRHHTLFLVLAYIISIIPAGNFIIPAGTIFAERLQYFPSIFLSSFSAILIIQFSKKYKTNLLIYLFVLCILALSIRTIFRTLDWYDNETLALNALKTSPKSIKTWNNIAVIFINKKQYPEALAACSESIKIYKKNTTAYANRALAFIQLKDFKSAENDIDTALAIEKNNFYANFIKGFILIHQKEKGKALNLWRKLEKDFPQQQQVKTAIKSLCSDE